MDSTAMSKLLAGKRYLLLQGPMGRSLRTWPTGLRAKAAKR